MNPIDRLRFAYGAAKAKAESRPKPRLAKWAERRAEEKKREMVEGVERDFARAVAETFEEDSP